MTLAPAIRQLHRWMSVAFTAGFAINIAAIFLAEGGEPPTWVYFTALVPLFVLFPTGLYMFLRPYFRSSVRA
jgi:hypothetical protein